MGEIIKPVFFIGMGRSGSSIIYEVIAHHEKLAWFSKYNTRIVRFPEITVAHRLFGNYIGEKKQGQKISIFNKILPAPSEAYPVWEYLAGVKFRDSFMSDIIATHEEKKRIEHYISKLMIWQRKPRFLAKITGPPRIQYLHSIFSDSVFIDIIRDPRAVISSLLNVDFWKRKGLDKEHWKGTLSEKDKEEWQKNNFSPVALTALEWRAVYKETLYENQTTKASYYRIKHEEFIDNPYDITKNILEISDLPFSDKIKRYLKRNTYKNTNYKYKKYLDNQSIKIIETICNDQMQELGYK